MLGPVRREDTVGGLFCCYYGENSRKTIDTQSIVCYIHNVLNAPTKDGKQDGKHGRKTGDRT